MLAAASMGRQWHNYSGGPRPNPKTRKWSTSLQRLRTAALLKQNDKWQMKHTERESLLIWSIFIGGDQ